jgi:hypothetical protein
MMAPLYRKKGDDRVHALRNELPVERLGEGYEARLVEWGAFTAYFEHIDAGTDLGAHYDSCGCPHWGYVFKGKVRFVYEDGRDEVVEAGAMYYAPPGHKFQVLEEAETVEFSPTAEYRQHMESVARRMKAASDQGG